uniref:Uncharacterized protein n=1 Tax=Arundo donax TaxID=35708 RepID=A0A0A9C4H0_ARUDO
MDWRNDPCSLWSMRHRHRRWSNLAFYTAHSCFSINVCAHR